MPDALVSQLARALNLPPDAARHTLDHLVATLREQIDATGQARIPGLGTFERGDSGLSFHPDDTLARAVNHRYAGLRPIEASSRAEGTKAEPAPDDPFAGEAPSTSSEDATGFQPLDSFVESDETVEPEEPVEKEPIDAGDAWDEEPEGVYEPEVPEPEPTETFEEPDTGAAIPPESFLDDEAFETASSEEDEYDEISEEPDEIAADAWAPLPPVEDEAEPLEDVEEAHADETGDEAAEPVVAEDEASTPDLIAGSAFVEEHDLDEEIGLEREPDAEPEFETESEAEPESADEAEPVMKPEAADVLPAAESDSEALDSLDDLALPEEEDDEYEDEEDDEEAATAILPIMAGSDASHREPASPDEGTRAEAASDEAPPPKAETVAPAVAATARESSPGKPAEPAERRGAPVVPILIGLAVVIGIVALFWLLGREPDAPPLAEQPAPADTSETVATAPPGALDTTATETPAPDTEPPAEPTEPVASADPLRSQAAIDPAAGGFSWVVGSELSREPAERRVAEFREQGLRAGVIAEEAAGRTRYRVALGQFESIEQAESFRSDLPAGVPADTWLLRL